jgi:hypothetical protein
MFTRSATILKSTLPVALLSVIAIAGLNACGADSSDDVVDAAKNLKNEPKLQGKWTSECSAVGVLDTSGKATYLFEPLRYEKTLMIYKDTNCSETLAVAQYKGEFLLGDGKDLDAGVTRINLTPKTLTLKANSEAGVNAMNLAKFCGVTDWKVNEERDVTAGATDGKCLTEAIGREQFDVYSLKDEKLTFGSAYVTGAPNDNAKRPTKLSDKALVPAK